MTAAAYGRKMFIELAKGHRSRFYAILKHKGNLNFILQLFCNSDEKKYLRMG